MAHFQKTKKRSIFAVLMSKKLSGLGKGLSALLADADRAPSGPGSGNGEGTEPYLVALAGIVANPFQPRKHFSAEALQELADSIRVQGVIQPISLRQVATGQYQLIAGERRWRASQLAGLVEVPAYVREATDQQMMEIALIENIQREDLNALEVARSLAQLMTAFDLSQEALAERVGKKRSTVANYLRLLKLPPDIADALDKDQISMGHARALLGLEAIDKQLFAFKQLIKRGLSVREVEELVQELREPTKERPSKTVPNSGQDADLEAVVQKLKTRLGTQVSVRQKGEAGNIVIPFQNLEDFNRVLDLLL
jgi:ParB family chromosome partitioning protein